MSGGESPLVVGLLHMDCTVPGSRSLKEKRRAMNSLKQRLRSRYNCSVAEIGFKDKWQIARIAVCVISDERAHVDSQLSEIARFSANHHLLFLERFETQIL